MLVLQYLQSSLEFRHFLHHVLDVVDSGEIHANHVKEPRLRGWQRRLPLQRFVQVSKIVCRVKRQKRDRVVAENSRGDETLSEMVRLNARLLEFQEIDARIHQHLDRVLSVHFLFQNEAETELPRVDR